MPATDQPLSPSSSSSPSPAPSPAHPGRERQIGALGTAARIVGGSALITGALLSGVRPVDAVLGLVVANAVVFVALAARGGTAPPLRWTGPVGHVANIVIVVVFLSLLGVPAMLFYGAGSLLAAARGYGACEMFAVSNWLRRRDDQFGCPFYLPADIIDEQLSGRARRSTARSSGTERR